jgi:hypothetical protein
MHHNNCTFIPYFEVPSTYIHSDVYSRLGYRFKAAPANLESKSPREFESFVVHYTISYDVGRRRLFMRHSDQETPIIHRSRPTLPTPATGAAALQGMEGWIRGGVHITPNFEAIASKFCETWRNNGRIGHGSLIFGMIL